MYCVKCRRVTATENVTTATLKNCRLMRSGQGIKCGKTKTQFVRKKELLVEVFLILCEQTPFRNVFTRT